MPKEIEQKLMKEAIARKLKGARKNAYVFGTLSKIEKAKGLKKK